MSWSTWNTPAPPRNWPWAMPATSWRKSLRPNAFSGTRISARLGRNPRSSSSILTIRVNRKWPGMKAGWTSRSVISPSPPCRRTRSWYSACWRSWLWPPWKYWWISSCPSTSASACRGGRRCSIRRSRIQPEHRWAKVRTLERESRGTISKTAYRPFKSAWQSWMDEWYVRLLIQVKGWIDLRDYWSIDWLILRKTGPLIDWLGVRLID